MWWWFGGAGHDGDWVEVPLLDELTTRSRRLIACYGNNDGPALRARLPEIARADLDPTPAGRRNRPAEIVAPCPEPM